MDHALITVSTRGCTAQKSRKKVSPNLQEGLVTGAVDFTQFQCEDPLTPLQAPLSLAALLLLGSPAPTSL